MKVNAGVSIHNRFKILVRNAKTGEVIQRGKAENIVLDRMYTRLCTFQTYFVNIIYGEGEGTPTPDRTTLFKRINYKLAVQEELIRAYPTSKWTKGIKIGANEENGKTITEVAISETTTNINSHAMILDAEGNPLHINKDDTMIVDIYASVYITIYDVDSGLFWYGNGLRDYLTGENIPSQSMTVSFFNEDGGTTITGGRVTRTSNPSEKWIKEEATFNETENNDKDIRFIDWNTTGLRCVLPRTGVFTDYQRLEVTLGIGDGITKEFNIPNRNIKDLVVKVDGSIVSTGFTADLSLGKIIFDVAPDDGKPITANYKCIYIPKDDGHILKIVFKAQFATNKPGPVMPEPTLPVLPGNNILIGGDISYGYYGQVSAEDLISGEDLCSEIGLTAGTLQNSDAGWLKFISSGIVLYIAKKTFKNNISWNHINDVNSIWGDRVIILNGVKYAVRLLSTKEWNRFMYPIHESHPDNAPNWDNFNDCDILVHSNCGNGSYSWTSTPSGSNRIYRGNLSVSDSNNSTPSGLYSGYGFRPVLEVLL